MVTARGHMWMGPRGYESWVPACAISPDFSRIGYSASVGYLNGGAGVIASKSAARSYNMTWGPRPQDQMRVITDIASGTYDSQNGVNLVYFNDPMTYTKNMAPEYLGNPSLAAEGAPGLFGWDSMPTTILNGVSQYRYPARSAVYKADRTSSKTYLPIPPGFTAWIGAHGAATGAAGIRVTPAMGTSDGTGTMLTLLGTNTSTLVNYSIPAANGVTGFTIDSPATGLLQNLVPNPSFETNTTGVGGYPGASGANPVTRVAAASSPYGSWAARATWSSASTSAGNIYESIPVTAGLTYSFAARVRSSVAATMTAQISWQNAAGTTVAYSAVTSASIGASTAWASAPEIAVQNVLAPGGAVTALFTYGFASGAVASGTWIEFDALHANVGATIQSYADGSTTGWQWNGAVNNSTSRQTPDTLILNSIVVQMLPTGQSPVPGNFITGQGNGGCQFSGRPKESPYNAVIPDGESGIGAVGMTAQLIETGPWL